MSRTYHVYSMSTFPRLRNVRGRLFLILLTALVASLPLTVAFAQGAPYLVIGTAMLDGEPAMMGTMVVAMVGDEKVGEGEVLNEMGQYRLLITEGNPGDTVVIFLIVGEGDEMMEYMASTDGDVMIGAPGELVLVDLMAYSAARSFSETTVTPGGEITVNIALSEYGRGGSVTETLPEGFTLVSGSIEFVGGRGFDRSMASQVRVVLTGAGVTNVIYKVTAPSEAGGPFEFKGTFVNFDGESVDIGGDSKVTVAAEAGTPASYDSNGNGIIELPELFDAIDDYFADEISLTVLFDIIDFYFSGDRVE